MHESSQDALLAMHAVDAPTAPQIHNAVDMADTPTTLINRAPSHMQGVDLVFYGDSITGALHARG